MLKNEWFRLPFLAVLEDLGGGMIEFFYFISPKGVKVRRKQAAPEMVRKFQLELHEVLAFFAFPAHWRHRLSTNLGEGWFKHLPRYLSRFPGCRNVDHSEKVRGCFLLAAEEMHR